MNQHNFPRHVAIIMDGNGRWAISQGKQRIEGHAQGAHSVRQVVETCRKIGIRYLTLYAFSTENWERPPAEVEALMGLFLKYLESEQENFLKNDIRLRAVGDLSRLPEAVQLSLKGMLDATAHCSSLDLCLALSYGGRSEIVHAAKQIVRDVQKGLIQDPDSISENDIASRLYAPDIPDPDLLIRTSNEVRVSNFLLWQIAYSEIVISEKFWPEFDESEFMKCLEVYAGRDRRFGRTQNTSESSRELSSDEVGHSSAS